ncbi:MAG: SDR family NAD(P)-dependent oxidoreductase [Gemmataceae bacterium]
MDAKLSNKVILVTGASGGIGGALVGAFVAEGARVVAHFSEHPQRVEALAHQFGGACVPFGADLTLEADVERLFAEIEVGLGPVDVLVASAGRWPEEDVPLHRMTLKRWNDTLAVNLTGVFLCLREFLRGVERHQLDDPAAVLIGSTAGLVGEARHADYAAAKAGLIHGLARECEERDLPGGAARAGERRLSGLDGDAGAADGRRSGDGPPRAADDPAAQGGAAARCGDGRRLPGVEPPGRPPQRRDDHRRRRDGGAGAVHLRRGRPRPRLKPRLSRGRRAAGRCETCRRSWCSAAR